MSDWVEKIKQVKLALTMADASHIEITNYREGLIVLKNIDNGATLRITNLKKVLQDTAWFIQISNKLVIN